MPTYLTDSEISSSEERLAGYLSLLIRQCEDHADYQEKYRRKALEYYNGELKDMKPEAGRSGVISNDLRAAIRKLMPSVMRTLLANDKLVEYMPTGPGKETYAEQATDYVNQAIVADPKCGVETALHDAIFDALVIRTGILTWEAFDDTRVEVYHYEGKLEQDMLGLQGMDLEIFDVEEYREENPMALQANPDPRRFDFSVRRKATHTRIVLSAVPRGSFLIPPEQDTIRESPVVGERLQMTRSDLIARGYDPELVKKISVRNRATTEEGKNTDESSYKGDDYDETYRHELTTSMEEVTIYKLYVRLDRDDDGIAEMYKFVVGDSASDGEIDAELRYVILEDEQVYEAPYAKVVSEREPHQFEGHSLSEDIIPIMQVKTTLLREALNNVYWQNDMQLAIDQSKLVDVDDVLNPDFGRPIWLKQNAKVRDAVQWHEVPFVANETFNMLQAMDELNKEHTGVTDASGGLDLERFQSMSPFNASLIAETGTASAEMIIRTLSRGGIKEAFKGILKLVIAHADGMKMLRVKGQWSQFDPRVWDSYMDCVVHVGMGTGSREKDLTGLQLIRQLQTELIAAFGNRNPFVKPHHIYNTLERGVESLGFPSADLFFAKPSDEEIEQMLKAEEGQPSPEEQKQQMEQMKIQAQQQMEQMKLQAQMAIAQQKAQAQIQVEQAQLQADIAVKREELQAKMTSEQQKVDNSKELDMMKYELAAMEQRQQLMLEREKHMMEMGMAVDQAQLNMTVKELEAEQKERDSRMQLVVDREKAAIDMAQRRAEHEQKLRESRMADRASTGSKNSGGG